MIFAGLLTMLVLRISPGRGLKAYVDTYRELKWAIVTVMAVLALAYVPNQSGMTSHLGRLLAETGAFFALDRKSTRLKSSHAKISYAVFCFKKKKKSPSFSTHTPPRP